MCFKVGNPQKYNALLLTLVILLWVISTCQASKGIVLYLKKTSCTTFAHTDWPTAVETLITHSNTH